MQLAKYTLAGAFGTAVHYAVLISLVENEIAGAVAASSVGALLGALVNYVINYYFTFQSDRSHVAAITRFYVVAGTGFALNAFLMWLSVHLLGVQYIVAQVVTTGLVLLWGFVFNRTWTFRDTSPN